MQKIVTFLWFDNNLEEAINFYTGIFKNSEVTDLVYNGKAGSGPEGKLLTATFMLNGQEFAGLNGGPHVKFNEAVSLFVQCESQEEIDHYWNKLLEDGEESVCGWLKDKFGLSWQVAPMLLIEYIGDPDREKADRVMAAMMQMKKIILKDLKDAYKG
jgi:predicted 3-demethylubiquinone-9 3-methyltransferase (glyoxalase superfamily)